MDTKQVISETFPGPVSWLGMEKQNLTQQKKAFTSQNKCTTTHTHTHKQKKTKTRYSRVLRHPAWKRRGPILVSALHKSVIYLLTWTLTHLLTALDPHGAQVRVEAHASKQIARQQQRKSSNEKIAFYTVREISFKVIQARRKWSYSIGHLHITSYQRPKLTTIILHRSHDITTRPWSCDIKQ